MQGYEHIAQTLKGYGVTHVFYIEAMLRMAIAEMNKLGIASIMAHSENGAGYMADGYARAGRRPGVCMCQSVGAANMAGGINDAFLANAPVIAFTGKKSPHYQYKNAYQEMDHRPLYDAVTKFNAEVTDPAQLPFLLRQLFREATTLKARPVHLDIPNLMGRTMELAEITEPVFVEDAYTRYPAYRTPAEPAQIDKAAAALAAAKRPLIVAGRGASVSQAGAALYALAKKADMPVVTTPDGKCLIDETDPLWAGIVGNYGMHCANQTAAEADLVLFVGTQTSDQTTNDWRTPKPGVKVIQIDVDPAELGKNYPGAVGLPGDARTILHQLEAASPKLNHAEWRAHVSALAKATEDEYTEARQSNERPIRPERLCAELNKVLPDNAVVVADTGFSAVWSAIMMRLKPGQEYFRAAGSLGWAFPASLGIRCALPDRPVVCFTGDGAIYYHLGEMETAVRNGIKTVTVVNNNQVLGQCSGDIRKVNAAKDNKGAQYFTFSPVDFSKVAAEYGAFAKRIDDPAKIGPAVLEALTQDRPALIEVLTSNTAVPPSFRG